MWPISNSNDVTCATTASKVTTYGGTEICILLLLNYYYKRADVESCATAATLTVCTDY